AALLSTSKFHLLVSQDFRGVQEPIRHQKENAGPQPDRRLERTGDAVPQAVATAAGRAFTRSYQAMKFLLSGFRGCPTAAPKSTKQNSRISARVNRLPARNSLPASCRSNQAILSCAIALRPSAASGRQRMRSLKRPSPSEKRKPLA